MYALSALLVPILALETPPALKSLLARLSPPSAPPLIPPPPVILELLPLLAPLIAALVHPECEYIQIK